MQFVRFLSDDDADQRLAALRRVVAELTVLKANAPNRQVELHDTVRARLTSRFPALAIETFSGSGWVPPNGISEDWDFESMLEMILAGEYELTRVVALAHGRAELRFEVLAHPSGGVSALVRLVESFGFDVLGVDDGTGYTVL